MNGEREKGVALPRPAAARNAAGANAIPSPASGEGAPKGWVGALLILLALLRTRQSQSTPPNPLAKKEGRIVGPPTGAVAAGPR